MQVGKNTRTVALARAAPLPKLLDYIVNLVQNSGRIRQSLRRIRSYSENEFALEHGVKITPVLVGRNSLKNYLCMVTIINTQYINNRRAFQTIFSGYSHWWPALIELCRNCRLDTD